MEGAKRREKFNEQCEWGAVTCKPDVTFFRVCTLIGAAGHSRDENKKPRDDTVIQVLHVRHRNLV